MNKINEHYSRKSRPIKVIQFGEGNFLRAFVDWMIHETNETTDFNAGVAVVQPLAKGLCQMLEDQDCLYTHFMNGMDGGKPVSRHYINDCIEKTVNPYDDYSAFLALGEIETARFVVSNTTEAGISFDENDTYDMAPQNSFPAKLTALMYKRFQFFEGAKDKGFILLPCELIDYNGNKLKAIILKYAALWSLGEDFERWIQEANTFCNTLVDRIVPGYPKERIEEITHELGYKDALVVESETFNLWVIEGSGSIHEEFPVNKTSCNAIFVDDVTPYKTRKVRILNGSHSTIVPISFLYGLDTVRETVEDPALSKLLHKAIYSEIIPTLTLSQDELNQFAADVIERFKNPFVKHYLLSIALNSMSKYRTRILPTVLAYLDKTGALPEVLTLALGAYVVFYRGLRGDETIVLNDNDDILELYSTLWKSCDGTKEGVQKLVTTVLGYEKNWGEDLNKVPQLTEKVAGYVVEILEKGMKAVVNGVIW